MTKRYQIIEGTFGTFGVLDHNTNVTVVEFDTTDGPRNNLLLAREEAERLNDGWQSELEANKYYNI